MKGIDTITMYYFISNFLLSRNGVSLMKGIDTFYLALREILTTRRNGVSLMKGIDTNIIRNTFQFCVSRNGVSLMKGIDTPEK